MGREIRRGCSRLCFIDDVGERRPRRRDILYPSDTQRLSSELGKLTFQFLDFLLQVLIRPIPSKIGSAIFHFVVEKWIKNWRFHTFASCSAEKSGQFCIQGRVFCNASTHPLASHRLTSDQDRSATFAADNRCKRSSWCCVVSVQAEITTPNVSGGRAQHQLRKCLVVTLLLNGRTIISCSIMIFSVKNPGGEQQHSCPRRKKLHIRSAEYEEFSWVEQGRR